MSVPQHKEMYNRAPHAAVTLEVSGVGRKILCVAVALVCVGILSWMVRRSQPIAVVVNDNTTIPGAVYLHGLHGETIEITPVMHALGGEVATIDSSLLVVILNNHKTLVGMSADQHKQAVDEVIDDPVSWINGQPHIRLVTFLKIINKLRSVDFYGIVDDRMVLNVSARQ